MSAPLSIARGATKREARRVVLRTRDAAADASTSVPVGVASFAVVDGPRRVARYEVECRHSAGPGRVQAHWKRDGLMVKASTLLRLVEADVSGEPPALPVVSRPAPCPRRRLASAATAVATLYADRKLPGPDEARALIRAAEAVLHPAPRRDARAILDELGERVRVMNEADASRHGEPTVLPTPDNEEKRDAA